MTTVSGSVRPMLTDSIYGSAAVMLPAAVGLLIVSRLSPFSMPEALMICSAE
jgi:hypothetical protein